MTTFLDYYKTILNKVSFDQNLFHKEYKKALCNLHPHEIRDLNEWLNSNGFQKILPDQVRSAGYDQRSPAHFREMAL